MSSILFSSLHPTFSFEIFSSLSSIPPYARDFHSIIYTFQGFSHLKAISPSVKSIFFELKYEAEEIIRKYKQYTLLLDSLENADYHRRNHLTLREEDIEGFSYEETSKEEKSKVETQYSHICNSLKKTEYHLPEKDRRVLKSSCNAHKDYFNNYTLCVFWLLCARIQIRIFDFYPSERSYAFSSSVEQSINNSIECYPCFTNIYLRAYYCFRVDASILTSDEHLYSISCSVTSIIRCYHLFFYLVDSFDSDSGKLVIIYDFLIEESIKGEERKKREKAIEKILRKEFLKILCLLRGIYRFVNEEIDSGKDYTHIEQSIKELGRIVDKFKSIDLSVL